MAIYHGIRKVTQVSRNGNIDRVYLGEKRIFPDISPEDQWLYSSDGTGVTLLLYLGTDKAVSIPEKINGIPVTSLAPTACNYETCIEASLPVFVTELL